MFDLFWSFGKVGVFGFGGGPSMIPLIQNEVVEVQGWLTREEFLDAFAFGNTLPGPITTKLAGYVGYKVAGWGGAAAGLAGITLPTVLAMIALASFYVRFRDQPALGGFLRGVRPIVIALLALVVYEFLPSAFGSPREWPRNWALWGLAFAAFALSVRFSVHPALLIVAGGALGIAFFR
jgi:chromate transporter